MSKLALIIAGTYLILTLVLYISSVATDSVGLGLFSSGGAWSLALIIFTLPWSIITMEGMWLSDVSQAVMNVLYFFFLALNAGIIYFAVAFLSRS